MNSKSINETFCGECNRATTDRCPTLREIAERDNFLEVNSVELAGRPGHRLEFHRAHYGIALSMK